MGKEDGFVKEITPKSQDFSQWYVDVIRKAEMVDYAPVKGCMVIRPYGYAIWEEIRRDLDRRFAATGHQNAYFPMFIPESFLRKEAEHVEGFAPEAAWVTHGGGEPLAERLAIRPTSETIICTMFARWIQSYRDLPLLINQWCNVVRWEKAVRPFIRTTEFLWQEGHTAHRTEEEAEVETLQMLEIYRAHVQEKLAIPVLVGLKSPGEKFAGALRTYTLEALMGDGRVLQAGTSHNLGQGFARAFNIQYLDTDDQLKHVWQTSWGVSTRLVGAVVMVHGDDRGLALPPEIAPLQVVMVPIAKEGEREQVLGEARRLLAGLDGRFRAKLDDRPEYTPGWKFNEWEMRGVPLRLEVGPRDLARREAVLVRRDTLQRETASFDRLEEAVTDCLRAVQAGLYARAAEQLASNTREVGSYDEFQTVLQEKRGFIRAPWCGSAECEARVKEETGATVRCLPRPAEGRGTCVVCGAGEGETVYFARAY